MAGDTGTGLCGLIFATLSIMSSTKLATSILVLGFPILDTAYSILRRVRAGKHFWEGDLEHTHHKLISYGFSEKYTLLIIFIFTAVFGFLAIILVKWQKLVAFGILLTAMYVMHWILEKKIDRR